MPVLLVGAASPFGYALVDALLETGGQVRAFLHAPDPILAGKPIHRAIGALDDVERLEAACAQVHTVIHLTRPWATRAVHDETEALEVTAISAHAADVVRVVVLVSQRRNGRHARAVEAGFAFFEGRSFETVVVEADPKTSASRVIEQVLAADARPS